MSLAKQTAELFLNEWVVVFVDGRQLVGELVLVTDKDIVLSNPRFGRTVRSLDIISGIEKRREMFR